MEYTLIWHADESEASWRCCYGHFNWTWTPGRVSVVWHMSFWVTSIPTYVQKQQGPHEHEGWGGRACDHLLEVKIKITLLRSTLNTCVIHRANWFLLIQICVLFLQISSHSEPQDVYDPETCRRVVWRTSYHVWSCSLCPRFWSKCEKTDSTATTNVTFFCSMSEE